MGKGKVDDLLDQPGQLSLFWAWTFGLGDNEGIGKEADGLVSYSANCNVEVPGTLYLVPGTGDRRWFYD